MDTNTIKDRVDKYFTLYKKKYFKYESGRNEDIKNPDLWEFLFQEERMKQCVLWIADILSTYKYIRKILVLSKRTVMDWCLIELNIIDGNNITNTRFELRDSFPIDDNSYDLIICTEILEHLKDRDSDRRDEFMFTGAVNLCSECNRILKKDGIMFMTTPNLSSKRAICRLLLGKWPYLYLHHVREYTPDEVKYMLGKANFSIEIMDTVDICGDRWESDGTPFTEFNLNWKRNGPIIAELLEKYNYSQSLREDTLFVVAKKCSNMTAS